MTGLPLHLRLATGLMALQRRLGRADTVAQIATWDLARRRGGRPAAWLARPGPQDLDVVDRDVPGRSGPVPVRVYRPAGSEACLLYVHGGGWLMGCPDGVDDLCRRIAVDAGIIVVSVDYRLTPDVTFPDPLHDCADALAWVRSGELPVDTSRLAVSGDSAGGNLAAALCLLDREQGDHPPLRSQVLVYPALDLTFTDPFVTSFRGPGLQLQDCQELAALYLAPGQDPHDELCSPLHAGDLSGLPPALVLTAGVDILREDGRRYVERLLTDGVPARWVDHPRSPHGFIGMDRVCREASAALSELVRELRQRLAVDAPQPTHRAADPS